MPRAGIMLDSFAYDRWSEAVGVRPDIISLFEPWGAQRFHAKHYAEVARQGVRYHMLTWEPWSPPPPTGFGNSLGASYGASSGPDFSMDAIASGRHDGYITEWGRRLQEYELNSVYLRFAHEAGKSGIWYPWSADAEAYVAAWRRVRTVLRRADADNVRMLWSPNASLYMPYQTFLRDVMPYWPGKDQVEYVGVTAINFGGVKERPAHRFGQRALGMSVDLARPFFLSEVNTAWEGRVKWIDAMRRWTLAHSGRLQGVVLSQPAFSGGQNTIEGVGHVQWRVEAPEESDEGGAAPEVQRWFTELQR